MHKLGAPTPLSIKDLLPLETESDYYRVLLEDGMIAEGVEVYYSHNTLESTTARVAVLHGEPKISLTQMDEIATRMNPGLNCGTHHFRENSDGTSSYVRHYYLSTPDERATQEQV